MILEQEDKPYLLLNYLYWNSLGIALDQSVY